jgi:hypothetical protein
MTDLGSLGSLDEVVTEVLGARNVPAASRQRR